MFAAVLSRRLLKRNFGLRLLRLIWRWLLRRRRARLWLRLRGGACRGCWSRCFYRGRRGSRLLVRSSRHSPAALPVARAHGVACPGVNRFGFVERRTHAARRDQEKQFVVRVRI